MIFRKAILIIHGFAGGMYDEENLAGYLELNRGFDVYQFTLPGHIGKLDKSTADNWVEASENKIKWLIDKGYNKIYLIGHSMGGVISSYLASKYNEVKKLVLAAPAFHYLSIEGSNINIKESIKDLPKIIKTYGRDEVIGRALKTNLVALKEFMALIRKYYDSPKNVYCDVLIIQGTNDNIVPLTSSKYVYNTIRSKNKKLIYIDGLTHDLFRNKKQDEVFKLVEIFLKKGVKGL